MSTLRVGLDISPVVYGTGVSDYLIGLLDHLPPEILRPFGYSLRRRADLKRLVPKGVSLPFPPTLMHYLWNRLHLVNVETFTGPIDIYHSSDWVQGPSRARKVSTVHDLAPFLYPAETDPQIVAVHQARMKWVVKECDQIICVSQNTKNDLQRLFSISNSRLVVIPEALPARYLLKPQLTKNTNYVLTIGARQPRKNIQRLISACRQLKQKLIIVGEKPLNLALSGSSDILFTGYIPDPDMINYLAGARAFVYPSLYEGFGLPILGAFHHQVPVACSNTSSLPEVAGDAAVYFDPNDEEAIARAITAAIANRDKLVSAGLKQLSKFTWASTAAATLSVYKSLM